MALFSGGSLMVGAFGRTDLVGDEHREGLAGQLFRALRDEILVLPDDLAVYPTHGAGSFCSAPAGAARTTTIGHERQTNPMLQIDDEHEFVERLIGGLGTFPGYFRQLPERNRLGPRPLPQPDLDPLDATQIHAAVDAGAVLVDTRPIASFAQRHPTGAISNTLRPVFASWLGWLVDLDRPLVFLLDNDQDPADVARQCLTIGHENLVGHLDGGITAWDTAGLPTTSIPLVDPATMGDRAVLDVRQHAEWIGGHLPAATHIELGAIATSTVPDGPLVVMCGHGERAMTAASILGAAGHTDLTVLAGGPEDWAVATGSALETDS